MDKDYSHPRICFGSSGFLVNDGKVLLIKHKKLGIWLAPGGHIDGNELPEKAAEREFWEETGIKVRAVNAGGKLIAGDATEYKPTPFAINLHWISKRNYKLRSESDDPSQPNRTKKWSRGCEQHYVFIYLVEPIDGIEFKQNTEETDGIGWFSLEEVEELETVPEIKEEARQAIEIASRI